MCAGCDRAAREFVEARAEMWEKGLSKEDEKYELNRLLNIYYGSVDWFHPRVNLEEARRRAWEGEAQMRKSGMDIYRY